MVDNHVVDEGNKQGEIGLWGIDFIFFDKARVVVEREGLVEYTYLLMLMKIWPRDWNNQ